MFRRLREKFFNVRNGIDSIPQEVNGTNFLESLKNPECLKITLVTKKAFGSKFLQLVSDHGFITMMKSGKDGIEYQFIRKPN
jgi:hypothetical protein